MSLRELLRRELRLPQGAGSSQREAEQEPTDTGGAEGLPHGGNEGASSHLPLACVGWGLCYPDVVLVWGCCV